MISIEVNVKSKSRESYSNKVCLFSDNVLNELGQWNPWQIRSTLNISGNISKTTTFLKNYRRILNEKWFVLRSKISLNLTIIVKDRMLK